MSCVPCLGENPRCSGFCFFFHCDLLLLPGRPPGSAGERRRNMSSASKIVWPCSKNKTRLWLRSSEPWKTSIGTKPSDPPRLEEEPGLCVWTVSVCFCEGVLRTLEVSLLLTHARKRTQTHTLAQNAPCPLLLVVFTRWCQCFWLWIIHAPPPAK